MKTEMKATITKVANGYTMEMDGRIFVGTSTNDIMKVFIMRVGEKMYNSTSIEGDQCKIEINMKPIKE